MPRFKLTAASAAAISAPGTYAASCHGLALLVRPTKDGGLSKAWIQRVRSPETGKPTNVGFGSLSIVSVKRAREMAIANALAAIERRPLPFGPRKQSAVIVVPSFREAADSLISMRAPTWNGERVERNWRSSFSTHVHPMIGDKRIDKVTTADVIGILSPLWHDKHSTAKHVRQRMSAVFEWARANSFRSDNPADSRIDGAFPTIKHRPENRKALPYANVPEAFRTVSDVIGSQRGAALGLMFLIHTGVRRDEARLATWNEFDLDSRTWTVPGNRTKSKRDLRVPLSDEAIAILDEARQVGNGCGFVFTGARGKHVNEKGFLDILRNLGIECDVHGFRSSLRDWAGERGFAREVAERALSHSLPKTEAAYARSDLLERRRAMMAQWSAYVSGSDAADNVINLRTGTTNE